MSDTSKAIGSLAKKQQDVTRQGTQKLKFVPTLPSRRKKEEIKDEPSRPSVSTTDIARNEGSGKGRGRGIQRKPVEMTASGPFAMGPTSRRPAGHSGVASIATLSTSGPTTKTAPDSATAPSLKPSELVHQPIDHDEDEEFFSEPDEGVEVIDLQSVQRLDWTAPESLRRIRKAEKQDKPERHEKMGTDNLTSRRDELYIATDTDYLQDPILELQAQSLFSIQFPTPFPTFSPTLGLGSQGVVNPKHEGMSRKVTFALDIKSPTVPTSTSSTTETEQLSESRTSETVDGVIGQLELYRDGTIRIRMPNGILFDMKSATQLAFQEQAVILNHADNRLIVLGEIDKRYVVSPDVEALLVAMDVADRLVGIEEIEEGLIAMDTT